MTKNSAPEEKDTKPLGFIGLLLLMAVLWAISGWWINKYYGGDGTLRGTFGDMFGAVNALFSGAALAGIIYSIMLQRKELKDTRAELKRTANAHEETVKLGAYTAMLNAYSQQANYLHELLDKRPSEEIGKQYEAQIKERDYYANKVAELVDGKLKLAKRI
jgi:hypothetical protein